jgi:hypothetical protein
MARDLPKTFRRVKFWLWCAAKARWTVLTRARGPPLSAALIKVARKGRAEPIDLDEREILHAVSFRPGFVPWQRSPVSIFKYLPQPLLRRLQCGKLLKRRSLKPCETEAPNTKSAVETALGFAMKLV